MKKSNSSAGRLLKSSSRHAILSQILRCISLYTTTSLQEVAQTLVATLRPTSGGAWIHIFKICPTMSAQKVGFQTSSVVGNELWTAVIKPKRRLFLELDKRTSL